MLAHQPAVLERHPVGLGELQVGDSFRGLQRHLASLGVTLLVERGELEETVLALQADFSRRAVGPKEIVDFEFVKRHQPRHQARHFGMSRQRAVLGLRQRQARPQLGKGGGAADDGSTGQRQNRKRRIHATSANQSS
jgi:hypothetical protein